MKDVTFMSYEELLREISIAENSLFEPETMKLVESLKEDLARLEAARKAIQAQVDDIINRPAMLIEQLKAKAAEEYERTGKSPHARLVFSTNRAAVYDDKAALKYAKDHGFCLRVKHELDKTSFKKWLQDNPDAFPHEIEERTVIRFMPEKDMTE